MNRTTFFIILLLGFSFTVNAQYDIDWMAPKSVEEIKNPITDPQEYNFSIIEAEYIFTRHCVSCHGKKGNGVTKKAKLFNPPPADLTSAKVQKQKDGALFWKISQGRNKMPSFKKTLSDDDRWFLVNYIRNLAK